MIKLEGGEPAVEQMVRAATRHGVDLSPHVSSQVTAPMLEASDLVVTMTGRHVLGLIEIDPKPNVIVKDIQEVASA